MQVVRRAHHHGVNALILVEHLAEILVALRVRVFLEDAGSVRFIYVTERHDVLAAELVHIMTALAPHSDAGNVQLVVWRRLARSTQHVGRQGHERRDRACSGEKITTGNRSRPQTID